MEPARFPLFDALRAVAALSIVFFHGLHQQAIHAGTGEWLWRFGANLDVGVPIFFGISGFLLYRPFVKARREGRELPSLSRYGTRRALRIVPAFWVALIVITIWFDAPDVRTLEGAVRFFGFMQVYDPDTALRLVGQAWSLNVEVVFYATLPIWAWWTWRRRPGVRGELTALAVLFAAGLVWQVFALSRADVTDPADISWLLVFPNWIDHLTIGMALAVVSVHGSRWPAWLGNHRLLWALAIAVWLACAALTAPGFVETDGAYMLRHFLFSVIVALTLAPAVFGSARPSRPLSWIGTVSYSLYLIHFAVIGQILLWWGRAPEGAEWLLWTGQILAASLALAAVGYYAVERPFVRAGSFTRTSQEHAAP